MSHKLYFEEKQILSPKSISEKLAILKRIYFIIINMPVCIIMF